jgi:type II restriction enzyme
LSPLARRAGWIGCNILLGGIRAAGRIALIRNGTVQPKQNVLAAWRQTRFLNEKDPRSKGRLLCVMRCIERMAGSVFTLDECYQFEDEIRAIYPSNQHITAKIRQQLQMLRDQGYIEFLSRGRYRKAHETSVA